MASSSKGNDKKEEEEHLEDAMDKIFHKKAFDYANLGGGPAGGTAAQVDAGAKFYKPAKPSKDPGSIELDVKPVSSTQKEEKKKVKHAVPQIGALGAFTALSGGLIGGVSMSATQPAKKDVEKQEDEPTPASTEKGKLASKQRRSGFRVGDDVSEDDIEPELDVERRKFSTQFSITSADDEDFDVAATGNYPL